LVSSNIFSFASSCNDLLFNFSCSSAYFDFASLVLNSFNFMLVVSSAVSCTDAGLIILGFGVGLMLDNFNQGLGVGLG
jgi:hypothetical protein